MSHPFRAAFIALLTFGISALGMAQNPKLYEETISSSDPLRSTQTNELDEYIKLLKQDRTRFQELFHPDYRSVQAFENSKRAFKKRFLGSIGYPPPSLGIKDKPTISEIGTDDIGTYYRVQIPIVTGVHSEGIYIVPKGVHGRVPLITEVVGRPKSRCFMGVRTTMTWFGEGSSSVMPFTLHNTSSMRLDIRETSATRLMSGYGQ